MKFKFRIIDDIIMKNAEPIFLPRAPRALFILTGGLTIEHSSGNQFQPSGTAFVGEESITYISGVEETHIIRWELVNYEDNTHDGRLRSAPKAKSIFRQSWEINLDLNFDWLLRLDQVTFPAGSVAPLHVHQGPGIRYVISGEMEHMGPDGIKTYHPGDVFLENGIDEPISVVMSKTEDTIFLRGLIFPRALKGRPSTRFVNIEDWNKPKPQIYHVHAEKYIELPLRTSINPHFPGNSR